MKKESRLFTKAATDKASGIELSEVQARALNEIETVFKEKKEVFAARNYRKR